MGGRWPQLAKLLESGEYSESVKIPSNKLEFPLHMAVDRKAPAYIIEALICAYPEATKIMNLDGNYPLHSACQHRLEPEALCSLISAFPDALDKKNKLGKKPTGFRQYNKVSIDYISKPISCWGHYSNHQKTIGIRLEKVDSLKKQKEQLQRGINDAKFRLGVQKDTYKEFQRISVDFSEQAAKYKILNDKLSKLESYSHEGISRLKGKMAIVDQGCKGKAAGMVSTTEYHRSQNKYVNEVTERVKLVDQDLVDCRNNIDAAARHCKEMFLVRTE